MPTGRKTSTQTQTFDLLSNFDEVMVGLRTGTYIVLEI